MSHDVLQQDITPVGEQAPSCPALLSEPFKLVIILWWGTCTGQLLGE